MIGFIRKCVRLSEGARINLPSQNTTRDIIEVLMESGLNEHYTMEKISNLVSYNCEKKKRFNE